MDANYVFKIEDGIPIPPAVRNCGPAVAALRSMNVGQSVFVPGRLTSAERRA